MNKQIRVLTSFITSSVLSVIFIVFATIYAELNKPFKNMLKDIFSHHWIGKGVVAAGIFLAFGFLLYFVMRKDDISSIVRFLWTLIAVTIIGFFLILMFYVYEFFMV